MLKMREVSIPKEASISLARKVKAIKSYLE
jgi:hypothetical protein